MITLEELIEYIFSFILYIVEFAFIKQITGSEKEFFKAKNIILVLLFTLFTIILHQDYFSSVYTIAVFIMNIVLFTIIFKEDIKDMTIANTFFMIVIFISELIAVLGFNIFIPFEKVREELYLYVLSNILIITVSSTIVYFLRNKLKQIYQGLIKNNKISTTYFFILIIILLPLLMLNIVKKTYISAESIVNILIMIILIIMAYIYCRNKNEYNKKVEEYDALFEYVKNFEEWIEKEQLNKHEYKNQLAAIKFTTKDKEVQNKIDRILKNTMKLEEKFINQLKCLPSGGIKGLLYYKIIEAEKRNINVTIDATLKEDSLLNKINYNTKKDICSLLGIYIDNAIEAASETKEKEVLLEIYEINRKLNFVITNSFLYHENFENRNKKGISTKGKGRGNGLYFAGKIADNNDLITEKQEIKDNYYIQKITIVEKKKLSK